MFYKWVKLAFKPHCYLYLKQGAAFQDPFAAGCMYVLRAAIWLLVP